MGLFTKLFTSHERSEKHSKENSPPRSRSSSVSINTILNKDTKSDNKSRKETVPKKVTRPESNGSATSDLPRLKRSMTTGQLIASNVDMKQFLDYWKNENLLVFHGKSDIDPMGQTFKDIKANVADHNCTLKSCFKKGTLLAQKKRLLLAQQSDSKPNFNKPKSNISKLFLSISTDKPSTGTANSSTSSMIPIRKWSSQRVHNIDKECEYDVMGMHDYYDNEYNPFDSSNLNSRSASNFSVQSCDSDDGSDYESFSMPVISPINSGDTSVSDAVLSKENMLKVPPGLENCSVPKHIHFDKTLFTIDPPQQICSKQPRVGEVEVKNGCVIIHKNTNESPSSSRTNCKDVDGVHKESHGLSVGGRGVLKLLSDEERDNLDTTSEWRYFNDLEKIGSSAIKNNAKYTRNDQEYDFEDDDHLFLDSSRTVSWKNVYQRVCHLREILPIASIIQQIPEEEIVGENGVTTTKFVDYIPLIILKNNKPSLIEILTLCDFISCSFIESLNFDMCDLSVDMFGRIIEAVSRMIVNIQNSEKQLNLTSVKLSFRNAPISDDGWDIFCKFLSTFDFKNVKLSLDLSLLPNVKCNVLRKKNSNCENDKVERMSLQLRVNKNTALTELNNFDYNMTSRDNNWNLFIASVACNITLRFQQLFLNNCRIFSVERSNYSSIVQNFFQSVGVKTIELGASKIDIEDLFDVAVSAKNRNGKGLSPAQIEKCEILSKSLLQKFTSQGVTKFNIRELLLENNLLETPQYPQNPMICSAGKRNILIDHALFDNVENGRSFSLRGEEDEIIPLFSKSGSSDAFSETFGSSVKGSSEDLMKLKTKNVRDMINY